MATPLNVLANDTEPGMLDVGDARIPDDVRAHFGGYAGRSIATVVPVIGVSREEWWLFDPEGTLVDVLCRHA